MCTSQVRALNESTGRKVYVVGRGGTAQWNEVFEHNPRLTRRLTRDAVRLQNGPGVRPYIAQKLPDRWVWKRWPIAPGELFLTSEEHAFGRRHGGRILIEPNTKVEGGNKAWLWERWQEVVDRGGDFVQIGHPGTRPLNGVAVAETHSFRQACAVLAHSRAFVGTEGGLHHAAAALGVPAVVLFSEFIDPEITGYATQRSLRRAGEACGMRVPCAGCRASMEAITVEEVITNLRDITA